MACIIRTRPAARQSRATRPWDVVRGSILLAAQVLLSAGGLAVLVIAIVYLRLLQGPIVLPGLGQIIADRINAASQDFRVSVGEVILKLGEDSTTSGLRFRNVVVSSVDGQRLLAVPRMGARFRLADLVHGRVQPVRIVLIDPDARIVRSADGRIRFGLGQGAGVAFEDSATDDAGGRLAAVAHVVDSLVGDQPPVPELARLDRIDIIGANLVYDDRQAGSDWTTEHASLRIWRYDGGARAVLDVGSPRNAVPGPALRVVADRPKGAGRTDLHIHFGRLKASELARQARELEWVGLIGGTVEGDASVTLERDGRLSAFEGVLSAENGVVRGLGRPIPFERAELDFRTDPARERLAIERFRLNAKALEATLTGFADLRRDADGALAGIAGQFEIGALHLDMPQVFADPLDFDGGRLTARWSLDDQSIRVIDGRLDAGDLAFTVSGQARATRAGWVTDLRAEAHGMTAEDLVAYWPLAAAEEARDWVAENVKAGDIGRLVAQMRLGEGRPQLALDFDFSGLKARYLDDMSPIEEASGTGHLSYTDFYLALDKGHVAPMPGEELQLAGSTMTISDFWADQTPADISLRVHGPTAAAEVLIDQEPLHLIGKLGAGLGSIGGTAEVEARLHVPLDSDLELDDVGIKAQAVLTDVSTPFELAPGSTVDVAADRLVLSADNQSMQLTGDTTVDGVPLSVDWQESYGELDGRTLALSGTATPELMAKVGMGGLPVEGAPTFDLVLRETGGGPMEFTLDADLTPARVEIAPLEWVKAPGVQAGLHAEGVRDTTPGGGTRITALHLTSPTLTADGSIELDADGGLVKADFANVRLDGRGDFSATLHPTAEGVLDVSVIGRLLDLSDRIGEAGGGPTEPLRLRFNLARLKLADRIVLDRASGQVLQARDGGPSGRIAGRIGGDTPVAIDIDLPAGQAGKLRLTSPNAGAALRAADLYGGARGGRLVVNATVPADPAAGLSGTAQIEDVVVQSQSTFRDVLQSGGLNEAGKAVSSGGMHFRTVVIPFTYRDGILTLNDAIAASPALGLKLNGTVNEATDRVDLIGVLSPAYALTGALNEVPVLGQILGGEGEGILAMVFRLTGPMSDPDLTVNPLSMLAPGFLRKLFSAPTSEVSEDFRRSITRRDR